MKYILLSMMILGGCGPLKEPHEIKKFPQNKPVSVSPQDEQTIRGLEGEIASIDLNNVVEGFCGKKAYCVARDKAYFNTHKKRDQLNQRTLLGLLKAVEYGINSEILVKAVRDAKKASKRKDVSQMDYHKGRISPEGMTLLICMTTNTSVPTGSGFFYDNHCFLSNYNTNPRN
ncbi:MAG: hypothetical protein KC505_03685 [Myxococcales bacterium]|nr:hypothetical protein [Myxococcales bacterium]USN50915.1 MAG: hypothetical protein H6731_00390 [Myxococcales bacterium]